MHFMFIFIQKIHDHLALNIQAYEMSNTNGCPVYINDVIPTLRERSTIRYFWYRREEHKPLIYNPQQN